MICVKNILIMLVQFVKITWKSQCVYLTRTVELSSCDFSDVMAVRSPVVEKRVNNKNKNKNKNNGLFNRSIIWLFRVKNYI